MSTPRHTLSRRAVLAAPLAFALPARAQAPEGPVTLVVPYTPGTGPDTLARLLSPLLTARLGQPVLVENRAGASGNIGTAAVARAAPDGRTLMVQPNTFVMNPSLFRQVPYDPIRAFAPVALIARGDLALVVHPDVPARTAAAFADLARSRPGGLDYASPGNGTPQHLAMALFALTARVQFNHIPYRGSAPAVTDLIGGRVAAMFLPVHTALPLAQAGRIHMLAIGSDARTDAAPDVPTLIEAGFAGVQADLWYGLLGPAGLAEPLVRRLNADINTWLADPATIQLLRAQGMTPAPATPQAFAELVARDLARWAAVIRDSGITPE